MKAINKVLIVFLILSFAAISATWSFIHSESFSKEISKRVSVLLTKKTGAELSFKRVEFGLFPPSTLFKDVVIKKPHKNRLGAEVKLEELGVSFTYASLVSSNLEIDDLDFKNGKVVLEIDEDKSTPDIDWKNLDVIEIFEKYSAYYKAAPIHLNIIRLLNIETQINNVTFNAKSISLSPHKKDARIKLEIKDLKVEKLVLNIDSIEAQAKIEKNLWSIDYLNVLDKGNVINFKTAITSPKKKLEVSGTGTFDFNIQSLATYVKELPKEVKTLAGQFSGDLNYHGNIFDPTITIHLGIKSLKSDWIALKEVKATLVKKHNLISVQSLEAHNDQEKYHANKIEDIFDLSKLKLLNFKTQIELVNAYTNTFLFSIRDILEVFKGNVTGKVLVEWNGKNFNFEFKEKTQIKNFELKMYGSKKNILINNGITIEKGNIAVDLNALVNLDVELTMPNSKLRVAGDISPDKINLDIDDSYIDLKTLGPIAGVKLEGAGPVDMKISGPISNVNFDLDVRWKNFSVIDLHLGEITTQFTFSIKDLKLTIPKLLGRYNQTTYTADGWFLFSDNSKMDLNLIFKDTNFRDAREMYGLVFNNMKSFPETDLRFETNYKVSGGFELDQLAINGKIKGSDLRIFDESADYVNLDFALKKEILTFEKVKVKKSRGEVTANMSVNLKNNHIELSGEGKGVRLSDFDHYSYLGLDYDGDLALEFKGSGTVDKFPSYIKLKTSEAYIENILASPSNAVVNFENNEIIANLDLLAGQIKANTIYNFNTKQVNVKALIESNDIKELLGVLSSHNAIDNTITGKLKSKIQTEFNLATNKLDKILVEIYNFNLKKADIDLKNTPGRNIISVDNGIIKKWDLRFYDGLDYFTSTGENLKGGIIALTQDFSIKSSIFQFVSKYVEKASGAIRGKYKIEIGKTINIKDLILTTKNNSIKFKKMPGIITELESEIVKENETFEIRKIVGKYGDGEFKINGSILFDKLYPKINLDFKIDRSTIPLFKRSSILVSGTGNLQGQKLPYRLNGKLQFLHGEFLDDPSEYSGDKKVSLEEFKKFLPEKNKDEKRNFLDLNISFETQSTPILVKNNLTEIYLRASGQVVGDVRAPEVTARIDALPNLSKFKFKGHDFIISQGYVEIKDSAKTKNSDLKFVGVSKINDYDMKIDLSGKIDKPSIALSSEPALSQEDLLSLLTIGVTSDMSKNLEAGERKSVTTVGIGTLLVDQLKINEDLNSTLGLKLSVMPEFKEEVTSLVQGKSAVTESASSRLKSSTKIKVNKQINKQVDVSLSSTVGGSLEQKQEVNVNYNFNKTWSLEGVYEVKPAEDTSTPNSVGADLKYRWSF